MKKYLKLFIFIMIIIFTPKVFAQDFTVENSEITSPSGQGRTGTYSGLEIYNGGIPAVYNIGTRYNGRLSHIWFNLIAGGYANANGFEKGHTYTLTMNMATDDWRNGFGSVSVKCEGSSGQELSNGRVTFINYKKIKFSFTAPIDSWCQFVYIDLKSSNVNSTYITGTNNWNLSSMVISDPAYCDNCGSGSGSGSGSTTDPNQSVIDNANSNTQDIINNQNSNANDIIDNANSNTQDIINNQNKLLGDCIKNYMDSNLIISLSNVTQQGNSFSQVTGDNASSISLMIQSYNGSTFVDTEAQDYITSTGVKTLSFVKSSSFDRIYYKINGTTIDTGLRIDVSNLENGKRYYLKSDFTNITQGSIRFRDLMITDVVTNGFIAWGSEYCTSKLDSVNNSINQSTQDIINNQNQNNQQQIESQKVCSKIDKSNVGFDNYILINNGTETSYNNWVVTNYIPITKSSIKVLQVNLSGGYTCFYNTNKERVSCIYQSNMEQNSFLTIPENATYVRFSIQKSTNKPSFEICKDGNQAFNDNITDDNIENGLGSDFFNDFQDNSHGLTGIITAPLNAIESLTSSTCQPLSIPIPFTNGNVNLPCMTEIYENNIPTIYNIWKVVSFGIIAYFICIDIFHIVKGFKDPESDKVEVLDL